MKAHAPWILVVLAGLLSLAVCTAGTAEEPPADTAAAVARPFRKVIGPAAAATVRILVDGKPAALAAVVDSDGYLVTKASLLDGKATCQWKEGRQLEAVVVGVDADHDLALVKIDAEKLPTISWRDGPPPAPGSLVATVGPGEDPLAVGVVSVEPRRIGGPNRLARQRGILGISLATTEAGPRISQVAKGSAAAKAGLRVGDRIESIDGVPMESVRQVVEMVGGHPPGTTIKLKLVRGEKELQLSAKLGKRPWRRGPLDRWGGGPFSRRRQGFPLVLPHDTALKPSDCGGPLVDTDGKAVGINIARALRVTTYAVPAEVVRQSVARLKAAVKP